MGRLGFRESEHFFLRLSAFEDRLLEWIKSKQLEAERAEFQPALHRGGLKDRAITRDIEWGVGVPQPGFKQAHIRLVRSRHRLSFRIRNGQTRDVDAWRAFWTGDARTYYFLGRTIYPSIPSYGLPC